MSHLQLLLVIRRHQRSQRRLKPLQYPCIRPVLDAALLCHYYAPANVLPDTWQSFNVSQWRANQDLNEVYPQLEGYRTVGKKWDLRVRTPSNEEYLCEE